MNVGSLFSGIGGIDLGLERAGHRVRWQCEADEWRRGVLATRFPGVPCYTDVRAIGFPAERGLRGSGIPDRRPPNADGQPNERPTAVDLLCGGFPCQDLSVAGRRAGLIGGERSSLFFEFARVADAVLAPGGWILIENVPGLLSSNSGRDYAVLLATLAELGFHDLAWRVLDSRHFGVPQRRRRVFILARRAHGRRACEVLLEPESSGGDPPPSREAGARLAGASGVSFTLRSDPGGTGQQHNTDYIVTAPTAATLTKNYGKQPDNSDTNGGPPNLIYVGVAQNQRGEVVETDYAHQLTGGGGKPGEGYAAARTPEGVRRLTPTECERLQGFPDGWTNLGPDSRRYAALGDAVTVSVAEWIGRRLAMNERNRSPLPFTTEES